MNISPYLCHRCLAELTRDELNSNAYNYCNKCKDFLNEIFSGMPTIDPYELMLKTMKTKEAV